MNKKIALLASLCLLVMVVAVSAQDKMADFSGDWNLDVAKSELGERSQIESMTMTVTQSEIELSVQRKLKRKGNDESIGGALGGGNRRRGRQRMRAGAFPITKYDLSGKETTVEMADGIMTGETKLKAKFESGNLILTQNRTLNTPRGERKTKTVETWELSKDGSTLTVSSERQTRRGTINSKMVFVKQIKKVRTIKGFSVGKVDGTNRSSEKAGVIRGGVVNGAAISLPRPAYPKSARAVNIKGAVNVAVIISKDGDVISATAVSGHPILQKSAVEAAKRAKFKQTTLEGHPVEVSGIIVYNFQ